MRPFKLFTELVEYAKFLAFNNHINKKFKAGEVITSLPKEQRKSLQKLKSEDVEKTRI